MAPTMSRFTNRITSSPTARAGGPSRSVSVAASKTSVSGFTDGPLTLAGRAAAVASTRSRTTAWAKSSAEMATTSGSTVGSVRRSSASAPVFRGETMPTVKRDPDKRSGRMRCWRISLAGIIATTEGCRSKSLTSTKGMLPENPRCPSAGAVVGSCSGISSVSASCMRSIAQTRASWPATLRRTASATGCTLRMSPAAGSFCIHRTRVGSLATSVVGLGPPSTSAASPKWSPGPSVSTSLPSGRRTLSAPEKTMPRPSLGAPAVTATAPAGTSTPASSAAARATIDLSAPLNRSHRARNGSIFPEASFTASPGALCAGPAPSAQLGAGPEVEGGAAGGPAWPVGAAGAAAGGAEPGAVGAGACGSPAGAETPLVCARSAKAPPANERSRPPQRGQNPLRERTWG